MVLAQDLSNGHEYVIYCLSKSLDGPELNYTHVEKLALDVVLDVQRFRHYMLLHTTTIIADSNPMYHILTKQVLGGKYFRWIIILQESDLIFSKDKSKNSLVFAELMCDFPYANTRSKHIDFLPDESLF